MLETDSRPAVFCLRYQAGELVFDRLPGSAFTPSDRRIELGWGAGSNEISTLRAEGQMIRMAATLEFIVHFQQKPSYTAPGSD